MVLHSHAYAQPLVARGDGLVDCDRVRNKRPLPYNFGRLKREIEALFDAPEQGVYGIARHGRATLVNPAAAIMTGHPQHELVGREMHELLHHSHENGECYPQETCPIYEAFRDGRVHSAVEVFWRKDGSSFPVEYTSMPIRQGGDVVGAVVVFRDLSSTRILKDKIRRTLAEIEDKDRPGNLIGPSWQTQPVGESPVWLKAVDLARRVAPTDATALILGESGTGKELIARTIHQAGHRTARPLIKVNCAALPASLVESELFGHERGAFTGAVTQRIGCFEQAGEGTLFLDEVGELPLEVQPKLLRVLQEREFQRVGGARVLRSQARVVAATNQDLAKLVAQGRFREDLYYRLAVFPIRLPPLRERRSDIPILVQHFLRKSAARLGRQLEGFSPQAAAKLMQHEWPGNVRELENLVERAAIMADGTILEVPAFESTFLSTFLPVQVESGEADESCNPAPCSNVRSDSRETILEALDQTGWKITGLQGAAARLRVHPNTLRHRMRRMGIQRPTG